MGGCATKPKVLEGDDRSVPAPAAPPPEPTKEPVAAVPEAKKVADVVAAEGEKKVEAEVVKAKDVDEKKEIVIVNDDKVDDEENKRQFLSNLLNENEKKGVGETLSENNTPLEPTKTESLEPVKQESMEKKVPIEPIETTNEPDPLSVEPKAAPEATATATVDVTETQNRETSAAAEDEKGKIEVAK